MKRFLCVSLTVIAVVGISALSFGRGGHGGGHHGGGHHAGHHSHHLSHHGHHFHHHVAHRGHHGAFSRGWHHNHGGAWGWGNGGYAWGNPWAAASLGTAAGWLGLSALDSGVANANPIISSNPTTLANVQPDENLAQDNQNDDDEDAPLTQPANAAQVAAIGNQDPGAEATFLPLGVYSIAPAGETEAVALLHLAVSKEGTVRGTYYDLKTDKDQNIQGAIDKKDHSLAWTVGTDGKTVFHTWLEDLTEQSGPVTVRTNDGPTQEWTIARYTEENEKNSLNRASQPKESKTDA